MTAEPKVAPVAEEAYPAPAVLGAAIATFFFPIISLIAALLLMSGQRNERKRGQLKVWAWASVAWILLQILIAVVLIALFATASTEIQIDPALIA